MKKIIFMLLFSFMIFGNGNTTDKMLLDMIKFQNGDKFEENYLYGDLDENGLKLTYNGIFSIYDFRNSNYYHNDELYTGRIYNKFIEGRVKNGRLDGLLKISRFDERATIINYDEGRIKEVKYEKQLTGKKNGEDIFLEDVVDCVSWIYPEFEYTFENKIVNGNVYSDRCSFSIKNGKLNGKFIENYENTKIKHFEINFKEGIFDGKVLNWDKMGNLIYESNMIDGTGKFKIIYEDIIFQSNYKKNLRYGENSYMFPNEENFWRNEYYFYGIRLRKKEDFINLEKLEKKNKIEKIYHYLRDMKNGRLS